MPFPELAIHTYTNRPWSIAECIENYARAGIGGISIWRETLQGADLPGVRKHLQDAGIKPVSLVRGGFFTGGSRSAREEADLRNVETIREAEAVGLPSIVLVCGATPGQTPRENYDQIVEGLGRMAGPAAEAGIRLLVEPLHPVYAGDRSAICSLRVANDLCDALDLPNLGIALDVYHVFWELDLEEQIARAAAAGRLNAYHICDFKPDQNDPLLDRALMGDGCIALGAIDRAVRGARFRGMAEVEIFSRHWWSQNQHDFLNTILDRYEALYRKPVD